MKLSGFSGLCGSFERQAFPMSKTNAGSASFLDEMKKTCDEATAEKIKNSIERTQHDTQLRMVFERLSSSSKNVLERMKAEKNDIKKDEWMSLCRELKDAGVITQSDFDYTRADGHLIPIGYYNESGTLVKYDTPPMLVEKLRTFSGMSQNLSASSTEEWLTSNGWTGDPIEYLNLWMSMLCDWKRDMSGMRASDGSLKFEDFSPIDVQINSCQKVADLVKELVKF